MKICHKCNLEKVYTEFSKNKNKKDGVQTWCKSCIKLYDKARYQKIKPIRIKQNIKNKKKIQEKIRELKTNAPCTDCGKHFHFFAMHFDHLPEFTKINNISDLIRDGWCYNNILTEISKCEIVCANCHAIRTYNRMTKMDYIY